MTFFVLYDTTSENGFNSNTRESEGSDRCLRIRGYFGLFAVLAGHTSFFSNRITN